jgi:hypothetical protein
VKRLIQLSVAIAAVLALAAPASAATLRGTVVHRNARAHSFVVAGRHGALSAIHARRSPRPGSIVSVAARRLRNGTFAAQRIRLLGRSNRARMRGVVTFVNRRNGTFVLSARGASILIHRHRAGAATAADATPSVGDQVEADGTVDDQGDVEDNQTTVQGQANGPVDLEGTVLAVDTTARTLTLSADDDNESGASITVDVPTTIDISAFSAGQEVELVGTPNGDGTFTLVGSSEDGNQQQAQSGQDDQGDNTDHQGGGDGETQTQTQGGDSGTSSGGDD